MQVRLKLIGNLAGKTGWHECSASPSGRLYFSGGVCNADLEESEVERMVEKSVFPYGAYYVLDPDAVQAKPAMRINDVLSTATRPDPVGELPPSGPLVTFSEATAPDTKGKAIISPLLLQKGIKSGEIRGTVVDGAKKYSLENIRTFVAVQAANVPKKSKKN